MQVHILGGGAIGQLFAFHLTRALRRTPPAHLAPYLPSPPNSTGITVHLRRAADARNFNEAGGQVTLTLRNKPQTEQGIIFQGGLGALPDSAPATVKVEGRHFPKHEAVHRFRWIKDAVARHALRTHELEPAYQIRQGAPLFDSSSSTISSASPQDSHIDALFLCTKADVTSFALEPLLPRLTSRSTLVFTQNGLGLADTIIAKHFPDPRNRPWIILSSLTHGLYRHYQNRKDGLYSVHASQGEVHLGVLPDLRMSGIPGGHEQRASWPTASSPHQGRQQTKGAPEPRWPPETLSLAPLQNYFSAQRPPHGTAHEAASLVHTLALILASEELKPTWDTLSAFHRRALRKLAINACINPLTAILECQNGDLISTQQSKPLRPMRAGIDAVLPLTTSAENERRAECEGIMKDVCNEISQVIQERAHRSWYQSRSASSGKDGPAAEHNPAQWSAVDVLTPDLILPNPESTALVGPSLPGLELGEFAEPPPVHQTLTAGALHAEVIRVLHNVKDNYSSMYQDVVRNGRATSEVSYVNGYIRRLADALNEEKDRAEGRSSSAVAAAAEWPMNRVNTPVNRMLERLVVAKCDLFDRVNEAQIQLTKKADAAARAKARRLAAEEELRSREQDQEREDDQEWTRSNDGNDEDGEQQQDQRQRSKERQQFYQSSINVPARERVGLRQRRAGGLGRSWEAGKLASDRVRRRVMFGLKKGIARAEAMKKVAEGEEEEWFAWKAKRRTRGEQQGKHEAEGASSPAGEDVRRNRRNSA
ncbi:2-dehydropantoate 2-reductase (Ketopantoate reductase) (KPA reductase) (KPR) [Tilletia horrida]|nr:2-dehydropantoate 2-reductase (Ketopantoate reductase) (KPA reductase) (KPR) [Tilletia horrida]